MAGLSRSAPSAPKLKVRARKDGAAIALDDADKRLMNVLQSGFPLVPEPYAVMAGEAGLKLAETLERTNRLLENRIIREITPIFDTRALGYSSMLVAAKVDAENPQHGGLAHDDLPAVEQESQELAVEPWVTSKR